MEFGALHDKICVENTREKFSAIQSQMQTKKKKQRAVQKSFTISTHERIMLIELNRL